MGYFLNKKKRYFSIHTWNNFFVLNSKQAKEAGRAFKSKCDHLIYR